MKNIILVKLGGSIISDKNVPYKAREGVIRRLAKELKVDGKNIVLAHGSGSFGHTSATKYGGKKGYKSKEGIAKVARDAREINKIVMDILVEEKIPAVSFSAMSMILTKAGTINESFFHPIIVAINQGLIPVFYGDVIWDTKWKSTIYSGEKILSEISIYLSKKGFKIVKIIQVGETNGVYDLSKKTIPTITKKTWPDIKKFVFKVKTKDVTGGMLHKIENALEMTGLGIETLIINGMVKKELSKSLLNKKTKGTIIK